MRALLACSLILVVVASSAALAPVDRPPRTITAPEASQFASQLWQLSETISAQYVREVARADLLVAALEGIHEAARQPFPSGLALDIRNARNHAESVAIIANARMRIGREPALEGLKGLFVAAQAMPRVLDPYCGLVPASDFTTPADFTAGFGFELDGEIAAANGVRRNQPASGFSAPSVQQPPSIPFRITRVFQGSPAQRAGFRPGDVLTQINGRNVTAESGTTIWQEVLLAPVDPANPRETAFTILRMGSDRPIKITVAKRIYTPESVFGVRRGEDNAWDWWLDKEKRIACIRIGAIDTKTPGQLENALAEIRDAEGLILDLRWCPGGFLTPSTEIAGLFMGNGKIASAKYRQPDRQGATEFNAGVGLYRVQFRKAPLLLLVNGDTSGGGELIACALQDNARAKVAGQRTLGKGSIQTPVYLPGIAEWSFRLTAGTFNRPSGKNLQRFPNSTKEDDWGIRPDKGCELPISPSLAQRLRVWHEEFALRPGKSNEALALDDPEADSQRQGALRLMRKIIAEKHRQ
jgi:carboxyl-terminal processing protease